jgi:hypothetical protein
MASGLLIYRNGRFVDLCGLEGVSFSLVLCLPVQKLTLIGKPFAD